MLLADILFPTLAVAGSWVVVGATIVGCGVLVRRALLAAFSVPASPRTCRSDLWIGLAAVLAYLQIWNLVAAVSWLAWLPLLGAALVGLAPSVRELAASRVVPRRMLWVVLPAGLGVLWLANRALASPTTYDFGLYHSLAIEYSQKFATIPGLGNLQDRLGAGNAHFLLASLFGHGPWAGAGFVLVNGLLVAFLFLDAATRFVVAAGERESRFARRMAVLLVPAAVLTAGIGAARLSEPDLDLATFVLVSVGALYLAEAVDRGLEPTAAVTSTAALAAASVTRPLYWVMTAIAVGVLILRARRSAATGAPRVARTALLVSVGPAALGLAWIGRQSVLSGYPLFPLSFVHLPVDWRMPAADVDALDRWTRSWARWPGKTPDEVLGSWAWFGPWLRHRIEDFDVIVPSLLFGVAVVTLAVRWWRDRPGTSVWPLASVVAPSATVLVLWFATTPDPRFVLAPLWLIPIALLAWSAPSLRRPVRLPVVAFGAAVTLAFALGAGHDGQKGAFRPVVADGTGPFHSEAVPAPRLTPFRTDSGLVLSHPANGSDQCWRAILCVAKRSRDVRLRGSMIGSGFAKRAAPSAAPFTTSPTPRASSGLAGSPRP